MDDLLASRGVPAEHLAYLLILLLVVAVLALPFRRIGVGTLLGYAAAWTVIFGGGWLLLAHNPDFQRYLQAEGPAFQREEIVAGGELRVAAALDGHFWVRARVNGEPVRFLVDTGASDVVLSARTADRVGIDVRRLAFDRPGFTASGRVNAADARVDSFVVGPIERRDMPISVLGGEADINLLGMRFLRSLKGWRVEGDTLVLSG